MTCQAAVPVAVVPVPSCALILICVSDKKTIWNVLAVAGVVVEMIPVPLTTKNDFVMSTLEMVTVALFNASSDTVPR